MTQNWNIKAIYIQFHILSIQGLIFNLASEGENQVVQQLENTNLVVPGALAHLL